MSDYNKKYLYNILNLDTNFCLKQTNTKTKQTQPKAVNCTTMKTIYRKTMSQAKNNGRIYIFCIMWRVITQDTPLQP